MSNFTPLVEKEYDWEGDTIKVSFSRLTRKDMILIFPALKKFQVIQDGDESESAINDAMNEIVDVLADRVPHYIKDFTGLKDVAGNAIGIETVINEFYFIGLSIRIIMDMVNESSLKGGKV